MIKASLNPGTMAVCLNHNYGLKQAYIAMIVITRFFLITKPAPLIASIDNRKHRVLQRYFHRYLGWKNVEMAFHYTFQEPVQYPIEFYSPNHLLISFIFASLIINYMFRLG